MGREGWLVSFFVALMTVMVKGIALLVSYVTNNTFPLPLSEKEEQIYLDRLKNGDEIAKDVLIERNLRLVAHIVKKFDNTGEDIDDLISIGTIGLIKAINTFDVNKKIRLATYAARCIENEILMHLRSTRRTRSEVSLYDPIGVDKEGNEITLAIYLLVPFTPDTTWVKSGKAPAQNHRRAGAFLCGKWRISVRI
jgi:RNA polymerase sporulation-specific sigma factor